MPDYKAIAAKYIRDPGEGYQRFLFYGRNKQGKTTLACTAPGNVLVIDPENGTKETSSDGGRIKVWPVSRWEQVDEINKFLMTPGHGFDCVVVDGLTRLSNMSLRFVMRMQEERNLDRIPGQVEKRDYGKSGETMKGMLYNFHSLPMMVIYTAQDRMDAGGFDDSEDEDSENVEVRYVPDLPKGVRSAVNGIVDGIGRVYSVNVEGTTRSGAVIKGRQRRLWLAPSDKFDTGFRSAHKLPEYIKGPTVPKLQAALAGQKEK